jgi:hypothetical protein
MSLLVGRGEAFDRAIMALGSGQVSRGQVSRGQVSLGGPTYDISTQLGDDSPSLGPDDHL